MSNPPGQPPGQPPLRQAALLGGGVIGGGWAARLLANGVAVRVYDPSAAAAESLTRTLQNADSALSKLFAAPRPPLGEPRFAASIGEAVRDADLIIESAPERPDIKQQIYAEAEQSAPPDALITSSTSGLLPSILQKDMAHPERFVVAHPFNPVYLLPLVEVVGGARTSAATIARAMAIFSALGMRPLHVRKETDAFIADRLLESVWREALWLVKDGVATTAEIDDAIRFGFGLRWAQMGLFETYRIAGGDGGMAHFLRQFAPSLKWPWSKLTDVPDMSDDFAATLAAQSDAQSGDKTIDELARLRDENLLAFLQVLRANKWGAGETQAAWEKRLRPTATDGARMLSRKVPRHWTDDNAHMNESRYLECFSDATNELMRRIGADEDYIAAGHSYFTVETTLRHLREVVADELLHVDSHILLAEGKKLRLRHDIKNADEQTVCTGEQLFIHVDLSTRRSCPPAAELLEKARLRQATA